MSESRLNRPELYTPKQVLLVGLYCLHRDHEYDSILPANLFDIEGYRFTRKDGKKINYFSSIRDAMISNEGSYPTLENWSEYYLDLINKKIISAQDITMVPLLLVQNRRHFNTILIHNDEKNEQLFVYIIESRSNNLTLRGFYPTEKSSDQLKKLLTSLNEQIRYENVKTGSQSLLDFRTCGAQHINYLEIIAQQSDKVINDHLELRKILNEKSHIVRRNNDNEKIIFFNKLINPDSKKRREEYSAAIKEHSERDLLEDYVVIEEESDNIDPFFSKGKSITLFSLNASQNPAIGVELSITRDGVKFNNKY